MDVELTQPSIRGLADAETELEEARSALDRARDASSAAGAIYRQRRAEEAELADAHRRTTERIKELYEAEGRRLEDAKRAAEEALRTLEAKLRALDGDDRMNGPDGSAADPAPGVSAPPVDVDDPAGPDVAAYEEDWYRNLRQRAATETGTAAEGLDAR